MPEAEAATRLAQQLCQLAKGSALLDGRDHVADIDQEVVKRAAFDCVPATRRKILEACIAGVDVAGLGLPPSTRCYAVEDLESQGLLIKRSGRPVLSDDARELMSQAGVVSPDSRNVPPVRSEERPL